MSTTVETRVEYDDRFRQRPELVKGAEEAMAHLDKLIGTNPNVPPPSVIRWGIRPLDPQSVELSMADDADELRAAMIFPARYMTADDRYARNTFAAQVWDDLLSARFRVIGARIDRRVAALRAELAAEAAPPATFSTNGA